MSVELLFTGNGPGELAGWVRPVARAARDVARERAIDLNLAMALTPSQFASGREPDVLRDWGLFDRILLPAESVKLALGLGKVGGNGSGAVVHLGGDLWFSARLASRVGVPACAVAETALIARRHRSFSQVFATTEEVANKLTTSGVPREKVLVTGDPRVDVVDAKPPHPHPLPQGERDIADSSKAQGRREYLVSFMPGSRDYLFRVLVPYFLRMASRLLERENAISFQLAVSPFLSPAVVQAVRGDAERAWPGLPVHWIDEPWPALAQSDLVVTIPGTNTVELAAGGIPFVAIAPEEMLDHLRLEGLVNWITRLPGLGRTLKRAIALRMLSSQRFIALPNQRAGRAIAPEWVGTWPEEAFISHLVELLGDRPRRVEMGNALRALYTQARGASRRIAERAIALAGGLSA